MKKTKAVLKTLGFVNVTGGMWRHEKMMFVINIDDETTPEMITTYVYNAGGWNAQKCMRNALGISN